MSPVWLGLESLHQSCLLSPRSALAEEKRHRVLAKCGWCPFASDGHRVGDAAVGLEEFSLNLHESGEEGGLFGVGVCMRNLCRQRVGISTDCFQANNILIVNLAFSDLILCTVVSPMTLMEIAYKRWPGPQSQIACQLLSGMVPVCIALVSTLTITGIAIDRSERNSGRATTEGFIVQTFLTTSFEKCEEVKKDQVNSQKQR